MRYLILFVVGSVLWSHAGDEIRSRYERAASELSNLVYHLEHGDYLGGCR